MEYYLKRDRESILNFRPNGEDKRKIIKLRNSKLFF